MKNILVITPTKRENSYMRAAIERAGATRNAYTCDHYCIGKAAAAAHVARALATAQTPYDLVAVIGFAAGTLGYRQAQIVCPSVARYHDCDVPDGYIPELTDPRPLYGGDGSTVFTGDSFVGADSVRAIKKRFGTEHAIFDMEITAVAIAAAETGNVPVAVVKLISDIPEEGHTEFSYEDFVNSHSDFSPILEVLERL